MSSRRLLSLAAGGALGAAIFLSARAWADCPPGTCNEKCADTYTNPTEGQCSGGTVEKTCEISPTGLPGTVPTFTKTCPRCWGGIPAHRVPCTQAGSLPQKCCRNSAKGELCHEMKCIAHVDVNSAGQIISVTKDCVVVNTECAGVILPYDEGSCEDCDTRQCPGDPPTYVFDCPAN